MPVKNTGYVKVSRDLLHSTIWETNERMTVREVWIDLNLRASHSDHVHINGNEVFTLKRGQVYTSFRQMGDWWHMSTKTVTERLRVLSELGLINCDTNSHKETLINLVNYGAEQDKNGLGVNTNYYTNFDTNFDNKVDDNFDNKVDIYKNVEECSNNDQKKKKKEPTAQPLFFGGKIYE